jgi:hypothetical protein
MHSVTVAALVAAAVGGTSVGLGGTAVAVGGTRVAVGGTSVAVGVGAHATSAINNKPTSVIAFGICLLWISRFTYHALEFDSFGI